MIARASFSSCQIHHLHGPARFRTFHGCLVSIRNGFLNGFQNYGASVARVDEMVEELLDPTVFLAKTQSSGRVLSLSFVSLPYVYSRLGMEQTTDKQIRVNVRYGRYLIFPGFVRELYHLQTRTGTVEQNTSSTKVQYYTQTQEIKPIRH